MPLKCLWPFFSPMVTHKGLNLKVKFKDTFTSFDNGRGVGVTVTDSF